MVLVLSVTVQSATNLAPRSSDGTCNAFVKVKFRGANYVTQVASHTLSPVWMETVEIGQYGAKDVIEITVWHKEEGWVFFGDKFLGKCTISLSGVYKLGSEIQSHALIARGKRSDKPVRGDLSVLLEVYDEEPDSIASKRSFLSRWFLHGRPDQSQLIESGVLPSTPRVKERVYGATLKSVMERQQEELGSACSYTIPRFIALILEALREDETTWTEAGLFRRAGSTKRVADIRRQVEAGVAVDFPAEERDVNGDLLKQYIRELPHPLLSSTISPEWTAMVHASTKEDKIARARALIKDIPLHDRNLVKEIVRFCWDLSKEPRTCMNPENLGTLWCANMFTMSFDGGKEALEVPMKAVTTLIAHFEDIFDDDGVGTLSTPRTHSIADLNAAFPSLRSGDTIATQSRDTIATQSRDTTATQSRDTTAIPQRVLVRPRAPPRRDTMRHSMEIAGSPRSQVSQLLRRSSELPSFSTYSGHPLGAEHRDAASMGSDESSSRLENKGKCVKPAHDPPPPPPPDRSDVRPLPPKRRYNSQNVAAPPISPRRNTVTARPQIRSLPHSTSLDSSVGSHAHKPLPTPVAKTSVSHRGGRNAFSSSSGMVMTLPIEGGGGAEVTLDGPFKRPPPRPPIPDRKSAPGRPPPPAPPSERPAEADEDECGEGRRGWFGVRSGGTRSEARSWFSRS